VAVKDKAGLEAKQEVLAARLGTLEAASVQLGEPGGLSPKRAPGAWDGQVGDSLAAQCGIQAPGGAMDRVALGHCSEGR
jgi:hypothetical protein